MSPTARLLRRDVWSGLLLVAAGGAIALASADLGIGSLQRPAPGFLGWHVGLAMAGLGALVLLGSWRADDAPSLAQSLRGTGSAPALLVPMAVFCLVLEPAGFLIAGFLLMWFLFAAAGGIWRSPRPVLWSIAATGAVWVLFDRLLGSDLPPLPAW